MYIITGVCGVGKTTMIPLLQKLLGDNYKVVEFDSRGFPNKVTKEWKHEEMTNWFEKAVRLQAVGKILVLCGVIRLDNFREIQNSFNISLEVILLIAENKIITERLEARYQKIVTDLVMGQTVTEFIDGMVWTQDEMKSEYSEIANYIFDVSHLKPKEVADMITAQIL